MFTSKHKALALTSVPLAALLALGARSKKEETTNTTVTPAPMTTPSTDSSSSGGAMPASSAPMGSSGMSTEITAPMTPASGAK
ncbi:MAG: hypothetical protein H7197_09865 [Vitreoscilla sp.]|nr:hypothetical protein [Polaromonas sp.]